MAKHCIGKVCPTKFSCNNNSGEITSVKTMYNLNLEARREERKKKGILPDIPNYENIRMAAERSRNKDIARRRANRDTCTSVLGIVRKLDVFPKFNIYLHGRPMLLVSALLASEKRLVIAIDATGDLLDVQNSSFEGKLQHTLMTIQASECVLSYDDAEYRGQNLFHPVMVGERISPRNRTEDFTDWILQMRKDTREATESYAGAGDGIDPIPSVVKTDCAMELTAGCLLGYRSSNHVSTVQMYSNVVLFILLRHDFLMSHIADDHECNVKQVSTITYQQILEHSPSIFKHCKSHVHLAVQSYRKNKLNKPIEFRLHSETFDDIFQLIANEMTTIQSLSKLIARMSIFVALFETEFLPCACFNLDSEQQPHHETRLSEMIATNMDRIVREEAQKMVMLTEEMMKARIQNELAKGNDATFNGHILARSIIDRMKQELNFGVPYLESVDKDTSKGKINICLVYYCYSRDTDDREYVSPRRCGGFTVDVDLPHKSARLRNPLFSPTAAKYLLREWVSRAPLWSQQVIDVAEAALDARIFSSNQSVEGTFRSEKHEVSTVNEDFQDIPSLINRRHEDSVTDGKLFAVQVKKSEALLESRRRRNTTKAKPKKASSSEMLWMKGPPKTLKGVLRQYQAMMNSALATAREKGDINFKDGSRAVSSKYRAMKEFAQQIDVSFMSQATFEKWLKGKRTIPLQSDWIRVIKTLSDKYENKK